MSVLTNKEIKEYIEKGDIYISDFDEDQLSNTSYDVTLGEFFYKESKNMDYYNPYNKESVLSTWEFCQAKSGYENIPGIDKDNKIIILNPGETILAHTNEYIGARKNATTMMKAKSSMGRSFIEVCKCAGWGDVGYINRWTMEITNNSKNHIIPLIVGKKIAQIIFFKTNDLLDNTSYEVKGHYQESCDIDFLIKNWTPESMLPKLYK